MRNFKRLAALFVAVAMIFSLSMNVVMADTPDYGITFKVHAGDGVAISQIKAGKTIYVDAYLTADTYDACTATFKKLYGDTWKNSEIETSLDKQIHSQYKERVAIGKTAVTTITDSDFYARFKFEIGADATGNIDLVEVVDGALTVLGGTEDDPTYSTPNFTKNNKASISVIPTFTANAATASEATRTVGLGTSQADAVKDITATVTDGTNSEPGYAVSNWTSTPAYDANKAGEYTFKGDVVINGEGAANAGTLAQSVTVTVTVDKIALDETAVKVVKEPEAKTYQKTEEATTKTAEEIATELNADAAYNTVEVKKDGTEYKESVKVTWAKAGDSADSLDLTKVTEEDGNSANVVKLTGKLEVTDANKNFKNGTNDKTISMDVTVVPAEIPGGAVSVNKPTSSNKAKIKVTVPAAEIAKLAVGDKITAEVYEYTDETIGADVKGSGEYAVTAEDIAKATAVVDNPETEVNEAKAGEDLTVTITTADKMEKYGFGAGVEFAVKVKVNNTLLLVGEGEDAEEFVTSKVISSGSGSATGIPSGNGGSSNTGKDDDKKDDDVTTPDDDKKDDATTPDDDKKDDATTTPATGFNDVADDYWAAKYITVLKDAGIINGDENGNFNTEGKITRAEFTKMVAVLFGLDVKDGAEANFGDCAAEDWFTKYVAAAVEAGYINGVSDDSFAPNDTITREDACTILGRALGLTAENGEINFTDADAVAEYAGQYIALLSELGFINGYEDGSFAPKNEITRAEAAKIIAGIYEDKNAAANAGENTEAETETEVEEDADVEAEAEVEAE